MAALSSEALKLLEIDAEKLKNEPESIEILAGNKIPEKAKVKLKIPHMGYSYTLILYRFLLTAIVVINLDHGLINLVMEELTC